MVVVPIGTGFTWGRISFIPEPELFWIIWGVTFSASYLLYLYLFFIHRRHDPNWIWGSKRLRQKWGNGDISGIVGFAISPIVFAIVVAVVADWIQSSVIPPIANYVSSQTENKIGTCNYTFTHYVRGPMSFIELETHRTASVAGLGYACSHPNPDNRSITGKTQMISLNGRHSRLGFIVDRFETWEPLDLAFPTGPNGRLPGGQ